MPYNQYFMRSIKIFTHNFLIKAKYAILKILIISNLIFIEINCYRFHSKTILLSEVLEISKQMEMDKAKSKNKPHKK